MKLTRASEGEVPDLFDGKNLLVSFVVHSKLLLTVALDIIREKVYVALDTVPNVLLPVMFESFGHVLLVFRIQLLNCSSHAYIGSTRALLDTQTV